ncbi:hypothetical protein FRC14_002518 [Serendipita sp. 396]|nr:hypothetical protein FRC14_002518 [Serendipita sp. 396]
MADVSMGLSLIDSKASMSNGLGLFFIPIVRLYDSISIKFEREQTRLKDWNSNPLERNRLDLTPPVRGDPGRSAKTTDAAEVVKTVGAPGSTVAVRLKKMSSLSAFNEQPYQVMIDFSFSQAPPGTNTQSRLEVIWGLHDPHTPASFVFSFVFILS